MFIILFLLFTTQANGVLNTTKLKLKDSVITGTLPFIKSKIVFSSKDIFTLTLYTTEGQKLYYKSSYVSYTGIATFYKLKPILNDRSKVQLDIYKIEKNDDWNYFVFFVYMSLYLTLVYKKDSIITRSFYIVIITYQLIQNPNYDKVTERIIHKYIF